LDTSELGDVVSKVFTALYPRICAFREVLGNTLCS
jgi:hypothetical protein